MDIGVGSFVFCSGVSAKQSAPPYTFAKYLAGLQTTFHQTALLLMLGKYNCRCQAKCASCEATSYEESKVHVCRLGSSSQHQVAEVSGTCVRIWGALELLPDCGSNVCSDRASANAQSTLSCCRQVLSATAPACIVSRQDSMSTPRSQLCGMQTACHIHVSDVFVNYTCTC